MFFLFLIPFQWSREEVKISYKILYMAPPIKVFFSMTNSGFHEVSSWKCHHVTKTYKICHRKRSVILGITWPDKDTNFSEISRHWKLDNGIHIHIIYLQFPSTKNILNAKWTKWRGVLHKHPWNCNAKRVGCGLLCQWCLIPQICYMIFYMSRLSNKKWNYHI